MFEFSSVGSVLEGLKNGEMVIVVDDPSRENEGDLVMLAEMASCEHINFMAKYGRGLICMPLEERLIQKLDLKPMVTDNTDQYGTAFTVSIDVANGSTGISAKDRAETILQAVNPDATPADFRRPGHIFPLAAKAGGVLVRKGHTEASVDLAKLCGKQGAAVICEILNEDGTMARVPELISFAKVHGLKMMTIEALVAYQQAQKKEPLAQGKAQSSQAINWLTCVTTTKMPTAYGDFKALGFIDHRTGAHHMALVMGSELDFETNLKMYEKAPLVRVHSECLTGDVFSSKRCDCGEQLDLALKSIAEEGCGVLVYLRQEGRGIGLINKLKCYELQENGHDTVSANLALGFEADLRTYDMAAAMLKHIGINRVRLMTNNPDKVSALMHSGVDVTQRVSQPTGVYPENISYLKTKAEKMHHIIEL